MKNEINVSPRDMRRIIIGHYKNPVHKRIPNNLEEYEKTHVHALRCNDDFDIYIKILNEKVIDACFYGDGCTISTASIDLLCEQIINKSRNDAIYIINEYLKMFKNEEFDEKVINEAIIFYNVNRQPGRVECATIGWIATKEIIEKE